MRPNFSQEEDDRVVKLGHRWEESKVDNGYHNTNNGFEVDLSEMGDETVISASKSGSRYSKL